MRALLLVLAVVVSSGCYTMRADLPGTWRAPAPDEDIVIVGRVDHQTTHWFLLYGLAPSPPPNVYAEPLLRAVEEAGGDGVANVRIDTEFTLGDIVWRSFTLGIVAPRTYRVRADVVRLPGPPPPGRALLRARRDVAPRTPAPPPLAPPPLAPPRVAPPPADPSETPPLLESP